MFYDGDKIAILLYASSKKVSNTRERIVTYKRFPSLAHIQHEVFMFARLNDYINAYGYGIGKYMPESELVDKGIKEHFIYNPIFDAYEINDTKILREAELFLDRLPANKKEQIIGIREQCEDFTAQELYIMSRKAEINFIFNKQIDEATHYKASAIIGNLYYISNDYKTDKITEEVYDKLMADFAVTNISIVPPITIQ